MKTDPTILRLRKANPYPLPATVDAADLFARITERPGREAHGQGLPAFAFPAHLHALQHTRSLGAGTERLPLGGIDRETLREGQCQHLLRAGTDRATGPPWHGG